MWAVPSHGSVRVSSGSDGAELLVLLAPHASSWYGEALATAGDVDADGFPDLLVGAPHESYLIPQGGSAYVHSGADGSLIRAHHGDGLFQLLGQGLAALGDVDGDGVDDYAISTPGADDNAPDTGRVTLHSGADGAVVRTLTGGWSSAEFGRQVMGMGDVDGDGIPDLAIASPRSDLNATDAGHVDVYSSSGSWISTALGSGPQQLFGISLGQGDLDGDGILDVLAGSYHDTLLVGSVTGFDSATGKELFHVAGETSTLLLGLAVAGIGDLTGDGKDEVLASAPYDPVLGFGTGSVRVYSASDGQEILRYDGYEANGQFGYSVAAIGDVDGDGVHDFAIGEPRSDVSFWDAGGVHVYRATTPPIVTYGQGCAGTGGFVPTLSSSDCPTPGAVFQVHLTGAFGGSTAFVVFGGAMTEKALTNGCSSLVTASPAGPAIIPLGGHGPGNGSASMFGVMPATATTGDFFVMQAFVLDQTVAGYSASAGLKVTIP